MMNFLRAFRVNKRVVEELSRGLDELAALKEEFNRLSMSHRKLSGRYYAKFGAGEAETGTVIPEIRSKDDLRRLAGITAGKPANHRG